MKLRHFSIRALAAALIMLTGQAQGQTFPAKMLTMVVPWPAGGATDVAGRVIANELKNSLGQTVIVENSAGAGGSLGTVKALAAPADGHMLLMSSQQDVVLAPLSYKSATFTPEDARTVAMVGHTSTMIVVRNDLPAKTLAEFVALMKSQTGKQLSYCTPGLGTIYPLIVERMNATLQTKNLQVPYQGFGQCLNDIPAEWSTSPSCPLPAPSRAMWTKGQCVLWLC